MTNEIHAFPTNGILLRIQDWNDSSLNEIQIIITQRYTKTETCHPKDRKMKIAIKILPFQDHSQIRLIETRNKLKDLSA